MNGVRCVFAGLLLGLPAGGATCDIRQYGAPSSAKESATKAIQAAVDACHAEGGGIVVVPPGEFQTGTIELKSNVELRVEAGARLIATQNPAEILRQARAIVYARGARNIAIGGRGTIDGGAIYEWSAPRRADEEIVEERAIAEKAGIDMRRYNHAGTRTFLVQLIDSTDVEIRDVRLLNSQLWAVRLANCDRVNIRGIYLYTDPEKAVNGDGIDLVSTRNVAISDSTIITGDDSICLKTDPGKPTENVTVTNCILQSSSTPLMIGTETHADIRHVIFSNSVIRSSNKGIGINVQDGATVSDIMFLNLTMELDRRHWNWWGSAETLYFVLKKRTPESRLGAIQDIVVRNIVSHARGTSRMLGHAERPLKNIVLEDLHIEMRPENTRDKRATHALLADRVDGLTMRNVDIRWTEDTEPAWASALVLRRIHGLEIDGLTARQGRRGGEDAAVVLEDVQDGWIRRVRAQEGTGTLFAVRGGETRRLSIRDADSSRASRRIAFGEPALKQAVTIE